MTWNIIETLSEESSEWEPREEIDEQPKNTVVKVEIRSPVLQLGM